MTADMKIREIIDRKKAYLNLLLLADEQEDMIDRYLERGTMYVLEDNEVKAECVVTDEGGGILELKNIAVVPDCQGKGYGKALEDFDNRLQEIYSKMTDEDIFIITADHGCDPTTSSTDHSREHIPVLVYGKNVKPGVNIGTRERFSDIGKTILDFFNVKNELVGDSFFNKIME